MEPSWAATLETTWTSGRNKKTEPLVKLLHDYFESASDCFECALMLMQSARDFHRNRPNTLGFTVMREFQEWVSHHPDMYAILGKEMKHRALVIVVKQANISLIDVVCQVYKLEDNPFDYIDVVDDLLVNNYFNEASSVVAKLKLHGYYKLEEIAVPLYLLDKMKPLENYMEGDPQIPRDLVKYLDRLYTEPALIDKQRNVMDMKLVSKEKLYEKTIAKAASKLLKQYNLPVELCPNIHYSRSKSALKYLIHKRYDEDDFSEASWKERVLEAVRSFSKLQYDLLHSLVMLNEYETALSFALKLGYPEECWPRFLVDYKRQCGPQKVQELLASWNLTDVPEYPGHYLQLRLTLQDVFMVNSASGLKECISVISQYDLLGIDAEWKPTVGLTPSRLALVQLAVWDCVFILDMPQLMLELTDSDWDKFYSEVLSAHSILKLGYGISEDLRLFAGTVKRPNAKVNRVVDLCNFTKKLRRDHPRVIKPMFPKRSCKGLAELAYLMLGLPLNKSEQCSDWEKRPLRPSQLVYAALDSYCLLQIYEELFKRAKEEHLDMYALLDEAQESMDGNEPSRDRPQKYKPQKVMKKVNSFVRPMEPVPISKFKFAVGATEQSLAYQLRKCGIDVVVLPRQDPLDRLLKLAVRQGRMFLTSGLFYKELKRRIGAEKCFEVDKYTSTIEQVKQVLHFYSIRVYEGDILTRCKRCNTSNHILMPYADMQLLKTFQTNPARLALKNGPTFRCYDSKYWLNLRTGFFSNGTEVRHVGLLTSDLTSVDNFHVCLTCGEVCWEGWQLYKLKKLLWEASLLFADPPLEGAVGYSAPRELQMGCSYQQKAGQCCCVPSSAATVFLSWTREND